MDVRRDYRITVALSYFKNNFSCNENGDLDVPPSISERIVNEMRVEVFEKTEDELDFDGERGQQLLRILLQMTMNDLPNLTSMALKILFRHFNQYHELVEDLKQVRNVALKISFKTRLGSIVGLKQRCGQLPPNRP